MIGTKMVQDKKKFYDVLNQFFRFKI